MLQRFVAVLTGGVDRAEAADSLGDVRIGAAVEQELAERVAHLGPLVLGRGRGVERVRLDVLVSREGVGVGAAVEEEAYRFDVAEETRESKWLEAAALSSS